jgi:hypothetical protein
MKQYMESGGKFRFKITPDIYKLYTGTNNVKRKGVLGVMKEYGIATKLQNLGMMILRGKKMKAKA